MEFFYIFGVCYLRGNKLVLQGVGEEGGRFVLGCVLLEFGDVVEVYVGYVQYDEVDCVLGGYGF